jgi:aromatic ring-opening dioxygenase LigB subunit
MNSIYYIRTYDFEGELYDSYIISELDRDEFEELLLKINKEIKAEDKYISSYEIYNEIIERLEKLGHKSALFIEDKYTITDNCPVPNSTYFIKEEKKYTRLGEEKN